MLFLFVGELFLVKKSLDEGVTVGLILNGGMAISWNVDSAKLVHKFESVFSRCAVVDGDDSDSSLLQELHVCLGHVTTDAFSLFIQKLICVLVVLVRSGLVKVSTEGFGQDSENRSCSVVKRNNSTRLISVLVFGRLVVGKIIPVFFEIDRGTVVCTLNKRGVVGIGGSGEGGQTVQGSKANYGVITGSKFHFLN